MTDDTKFPEGKLNANDEGELMVMIGTESGRVVVRFPKPVAWIGFPPEQALELAETLIAHAVGLGVKRPVSITLGAKPAKGSA